MSTALLVNQLGFLETSKRIDPSGNTAQVVEVLNRKMGEIMNEAPAVRSNDILSNTTTRRAALPTVTRRQFNKGVARSSSKTTSIRDVIAMFEGRSEIDEKICDINPDPALTRMNEVNAFIEAMGQGIITDLFYGSQAGTPDGFDGLAARMSGIDNRWIMDGGAKGANCASIYIVNWDGERVFLMYPRNMTDNIGIVHRDLGLRDCFDAANNKYLGYVDVVNAHIGLCVRDPRSIGRYANISTSTTPGADNTFNEDFLLDILANMNTGPGTRIYCNETIHSQIRKRAKNKSNVLYAPGDPFGTGLPPTFEGIPIRQISRELLLNSETAITAASVTW
jgi:hypothetical protein